jgi:uncharacterized repeat protein (TIGR03803 family)
MQKQSRFPIFAFSVLTAVLLAVGSATAASDTVILDFPESGAKGLNPTSKLVDVSGRLYGTTPRGGVCYACGVVFELTAKAGGVWKYHLLYALKSSGDAQNPVGNIVFDAAGNLYSAASAGGANNLGAVFALTLGANGKWTERLIHSFGAAADGSLPAAGVTIDAAGNLYGTTSAGGANGYGTVYKLSPNSNGSWSESILYNFGPAPDGLAPSAELIFDPKGNIYGTTVAGGTAESGTVYELSPNAGGWTETILYNFPTPGVGYPVAPLLLDSAGNLYGVGKGDGQNGSAFELTPHPNGSWSEKTLYTFHNRRHGFNPYSGLTSDAKGNLWGTADYGGPDEVGVVYKLIPGAGGVWTQKVVHSFGGGNDGAYVSAGVTFSKSGVAYGATVAGGADNQGTVYEIKP